MARPLSDEKRSALLAAAAAAVASLGVVASTLKIARDAGVAEGTLFRYFPTKDDLYKQLYLELKSDLIGYLSADLPAGAGIKAQFQHLWSRFIDWGLASPEKHRALRQLEVSQKIVEAGRHANDSISHDLQGVVEEGFRTGVLRDQPVMFLWGVIQGIADVVLEAASHEPAKIDECKNLGWEALWGAIARHGR